MKKDDRHIDKPDESESKKFEELNNKYLRALADYQNLEKQTADWKEDFVRYANSGLIQKLLEVLDDLEKAEEHINDDGLKLIISKFRNILNDEGIEELKLNGSEFNPAEAEVVSTEPGEKSNIVTKTLQKGYKLKDKVIRPAKVIVSAKE